MRKITSALFFLLPVLGFSQSAEQKIQAYLDANRTKFGLTTQDVSDWFVESKLNSETTHIDNYFIKQRYNGTEIFRAVSNFWIKDGSVINGGEGLVANTAQKVNATAPSFPVLQALAAAESLLSVQPQPHMIIETISPKEFVIANGDLDQIKAELVYQQMDDNTLRLAWDFTIDVVAHKHLWSVRIDALDGKLLEKNDMVISCNFGPKANTAIKKYDATFTRSFFKQPQSMLEVQAGSYRVIPYNMESPNHGPRVLLSDPNDLTASPYGWHDTNGVAGAEYTTTRGNNAYAQEDVNANDGTGATASGGTALLFDFPYLGNSDQPLNYQPASLTNLFYMTNMMHDIFYHYGFNEVNGNFQQNNYGNGGTTTFSGDAVFADGQDGSGTDNSNFQTPVDGQRPRMQMYLWDVGPLTTNALNVISPAGIAGPRAIRDNSFSPGHVALPIAPNGIESDLVLFNDGSGDTADACQAATNSAAMNGHIVVIRRGDCTFVDKTLAAQNAGATAVIIVNNEATGVIGMAGANIAVTIPSVSMAQDVGEALIASIQAGTVHAILSAPEAPFVNSDGDFDNGIISHEYGHGISTRLTGGPANSSCLQNSEQEGEGWSDWFAMMLQMKAGDTAASPRGIATFVLNEAPTAYGLREFPYTTDMNINPFTFNDTNSMTYVDENGTTQIDVHSVGSVWATMLWDLSWAYVNKYGFDSNIFTGTGGNNKVLRLILDAMKLQPCGPSFIQARNAIIAADQATTGGSDTCMIWQVFARRGLGVNASSGTNSGVAGITDQVEDFNVPAGCELSAVTFNEGMVRLYPNPSNGLVSVRIQNFSGKLNLQVTDVNGRIVYDAPNTNFSEEQTIDLSHLQTGMYLVKVSGENMSFTKKLIKN